MKAKKSTASGGEQKRGFDGLSDDCNSISESKMRSENPLIINEAQLILAEKRTHLAALRTGLAVLALPMVVISYLVTVSGHIHHNLVMEYLVILMVLCAGLVVVGIYLLVKSLVKLHRAERAMIRLKAQHSILSQVMD
ncbi:MAG: hypothetical protein HQK57_08215 [Deltaproteobacteria bacterium]|nr:hypothetical protein [Deltaproteobacteria bacterium]MBF0508893.1 hypothetical protein [Deltaproteobacteria bacterium]MBF0524316.1 hypothetical protein [Deltaproteobacteria bacterium]